ncbi:LCP family protein [Parafannyhessea umbonata]|uniref:Cell envelope-related function transcriptional attenuator common domain-containing protein n=1 Tax=Parafannyhessea umbonata TaxID=604330 RepID=A0A1H1P472_9ACTN|nr:LCP family protein [Parafannyhessea umbonata]SDS05987.1 cell envelope-related function transcriptional attenuator common domain-containing protein [Parafannyhessea umbonata]
MARKNMGDEDLIRDARGLSRGCSRAHYAQARSHRRTRRIVKVALACMLALVVAAAGLGAAYLGNINSRLRKNIDSSLLGTLSKREAGKPFYMLLLGVDRDEARAKGSEYGSSEGAYRSDSIMLVRIDPQKKKATLVSIPRDLRVDMGEYGTQKINAAYALGGPTLAVKTVQKLSGIKISHYAEVDMDGMEKVVDAVGGVTVNLGVAVKDPKYTKLDLPAGKVKLNGKKAALLCRARHAYDSYGAGDFYRAANQRAVIAAVAKKVLSSDVATMTKTVTAMADMVHTDMSATDIVSLASDMRGMDTNKDIMTGMAPTESSYVDGGWYEILRDSAWEKMMARVEKGKSPYSSSDEDPTSGISAASGSAKKSSAEDDASSSEEDASDVEPAYEGSVRVLNGSGISGLASQSASSLANAGFDAVAGNAAETTRETKVIYNGDDALAKAKGVIETLGLDVAPIANDGSYVNTQDVIVILGSDQG